MSVSAPSSSFYISNPVMNDPNVLKQRALDYIAAQMPAGWVVQPGDQIDLMCEAFAQQAAEQADVTNAMLDNAFRYFGMLVGVPPIDAVQAIANCTFTVKDTAGYTIPAGTIVAIADATNTLQGFDLLNDLVIPAASSTGVAQVVAETAGTVTNGLSGTATLITAPAFVTGASLAAASGGIDAELDGVYLGRLAETLTLLTPRPVLAADFALLARSVPGVFRAAAVDNLKPGPPYDGAAEASGQEKSVTVAVADTNGLTVGSTIRGNVATLLQADREQNFKVWVVDPQYPNVDAGVDVYAWPGFDTTDVQTRVTAAIQAYITPANFNGDQSGNVARWTNDPTIRLAVLSQIIQAVSGVRYVENLKLALHGGTLTAADLALGGSSLIPPLPTSGTITVTPHATT